jgi:hypothetical protein
VIEINDECMFLAIGGEIIATARFNQHAAADGNGLWIVSARPARLFGRNQAVTVLKLAERLAVGYGGNDPFVRTWRRELFLRPIDSSGSGPPRPYPARLCAASRPTAAPVRTR